MPRGQVINIKLAVEPAFAQKMVGKCPTGVGRQPVCGGLDRRWRPVLSSVPRGATVRDLRGRIEDQFGLLYPTYSLHYLDDGELNERSTLRREHIDDGATLTLRLWSNWAALLVAAAGGTREDTEVVLQEIDDDSGSEEWRRRRCWVALFLACHLGHFELCCRLLETGWADVNAQRPSTSACSLLDRTPLHAAAAAGQWRCMCLLLEQGAAVALRDANGRTAQALASANKRLLCERSLKFCAWNWQKAKLSEEQASESAETRAMFERLAAARRAHQFADSALSTWLRGDLQRLYMAEVTNPSPLPPGDCAPASTLVINSRCASRMSTTPTRRLPDRSKSVMSRSLPVSPMRALPQGRMQIQGWHQQSRASPKAEQQDVEDDIELGKEDEGIDREKSTDDQSCSGSERSNSENKDQSPSKVNWRFSRYTCFDPQRARYLVPSGWALRCFSESGLRRGLHIRKEVLPRPPSLEPPRAHSSMSQRRPTSGEREKLLRHR